MKGFFIKKAFFDGWDNLIGMVVMNIIYIALFFLGVSVVLLILSGQLLFIFALLAILFVSSLYSGAVSGAVYGYSSYKTDTWADLKAGFSRYFRHSLVTFVFSVFIISLVLDILLFTYVFDFGSAGKIIKVILICLLIWTLIFYVLCLPYFFALSSYLPGDRPLKTLKKCFIIVGDNMGFTLFFFLYNIVCFVLTCLTVGLVPGVAGMNLASHDAVRLLMLKYDYLEDNPEADRKHIPWAEILYDEEDKIGPRSFKSMIFPWK